MTCKSLHEKASCKTLHEVLPGRLVLKGVLQRQKPQVFQQNLEADKDKHDATHDGGGFFVARAKGVADRHAGDGEDKRCDAYKRYSGHDVDGKRGERDAHGQGVNRGGDGEDQVLAQVNLFGILAVAFILVSVKASHNILPPIKASRIKAIQWSMGPMMPMN